MFDGDPAAGPRAGRVRPVRRLPRRATGVADDSRWRRSSRSRCGSTPGAGAGCRSTCAPASRWPRAGGRSRSASPKRRCGSSPTQDPSTAARPSELVFELSDDPQVRIEVRAKVPGPAFELGSRRADARRRQGVRRGGRPGGLRAAAARRDAARAPAVHARRADRADLGGVRAGDRAAPGGRSPTSRARGGRRRRSDCPARRAGGCPTATGRAGSGAGYVS